MLQLLGEFVRELRAAGIPVSTTEHLDAARALVAVDLLERDVVKASLAATLVKDETHYAAFELAFEVFFAAAHGAGGDEDGGDAAGTQGAEGAPVGMGGGAEGDLSAEELAAMLFRALRDGDEAALAGG